MRRRLDVGVSHRALGGVPENLQLTSQASRVFVLVELQVFRQAEKVGIADVGTVQEGEQVEKREPGYKSIVAGENTVSSLVAGTSGSTYVLRIKAFSLMLEPPSMLAALLSRYSTCSPTGTTFSSK